jgi:hypothetical protein
MDTTHKQGPASCDAYWHASDDRHMHMPQGVVCLAASMSAHRTSNASCTAAAAAGLEAGQGMAVRRHASGYSAAFVQSIVTCRAAVAAATAVMPSVSRPRQLKSAAAIAVDCGAAAATVLLLPLCCCCWYCAAAAATVLLLLLLPLCCCCMAVRRHASSG